MPDYYSSPRISGEWLDCSMPMTFDQYSNCGYNCLYCFATFQRGIGRASRNYWLKKVKRVNVEKFKKIFTEADKHPSFAELVKNKIVMQWGGMSDPFCPLEEEFGDGYKILEFLNEIEYPCRFSSKTDLFLRNEKYFELITRKPHLWFYMASIITLDEKIAEKLEGNVPSPMDRFRNLKKLSDAGIYTTLRLRPYILGISDKDVEGLFKLAKWAGCKGVSTEFFCLESRITPSLQRKYDDLSALVGFDIVKFYKLGSKGAGYLRLNYEIKRKYIDQMVALADKYDLKLFVSDSDHKDKSMGGSCCGLPMENPILGNYQKSQFTEAIAIAKKNKDHTVKFSEVVNGTGEKWLKGVVWGNAEGLNTGTTAKKSKFKKMTLYDYMRFEWNNTKRANSPFRYFAGVLYPIGLDENKNIIYKLDLEKAKMTNKCLTCAGNCRYAGRKPC